jgi:glycogen debranching enzyme
MDRGFVSQGQAEPPAAIQQFGEWYIRLSEIAATIRKHVLKDNDAFLITDIRGDFPEGLPSELGYYHRGTRYLSVLELRLNGERPLLLHSEATSEPVEIKVKLSNERQQTPQGPLPKGALYLERAITLEEDVFYHRLIVTNLHVQEIQPEIRLTVGSDFADIFEVRGVQRHKRGELLSPESFLWGVRLCYHGCDGIMRETDIRAEPQPDEVKDNKLIWRPKIAPRGSWAVMVNVSGSQTSPSTSAPLYYPIPRKNLRWLKESPQFTSNHPVLDTALRQALVDIGLLMSVGPEGLYPTAGIPWFVSLFGRDAIITSKMLAPWRPEVGISVLQMLAHLQAQKLDDFTDSEPGKILHELREGEMANLRQIPFIPYYGSIDTTPLFIHLVRLMYGITGQRELVEQLWSSIKLSLEWMQRYGDMDADGYLEYIRRSPIGLLNQCWKDSYDSIMHKDGQLACAPIAPCEAQAYAFRAWQDAQELALMLGDHEERQRAADQAQRLSQRFHKDFWWGEEGTFFLALDGSKLPCQVVASNAGHVLMAGLATHQQAHSTAQRLMGRDMFSGYGIRTLSCRELRYNPMSYHNGSIWPHDNALIAEGFRRYGLEELVGQLLLALLDACGHFPLHRLPELFCGFDRTESKAPVPYPVAASPQAWASSALLHMVTMLFGLEVDGVRKRLTFRRPFLPKGIDYIHVQNWRPLGGLIEFTIHKGQVSASVEIHTKSGDFDVIILA